MAIDTLERRSSMLNFGSGDLLPVPDATLTSPDWLTLLDLYSGISAAIPIPPAPPPDETLNPDIEPDLIGYLLGIVAITDLIDDRIYPLEIPQHGLRPCIVYSIQNRFRDRAQDGDTGLANALIEFDCQADSYAEVRAMETALNSDGVLNGSIHSQYIGDSWIQSAEITDANDDNTPTIFNDGRGIFHARLTLDLWYEEAVPAGV